MSYRLNPFVRKYKRGDKVALFNPLTLDTIYLTSEEYKLNKESPCKILFEHNIFVSGDFDSLEYFNKHTPDLNAPEIDVAYFILTSVCNFRCKYCFVETRLEHNAEIKMSDKTAQKCIDLLKNNIHDKEISIVFYGGEPLLRFSTILNIVEYANSVGLSANYVMVTNGSIMNDNIARFLKDHNFEIGISLDGLKNTNDSMRIDSFQTGTFDSVSETIEILLKNGIVPGISCTLSRHNMEKPLEIKEILEKYKLPCVSYNLPAPNGNVNITDNERKVLVKNLMEAETALLRSGILEDKVVDRRFRAFIEKYAWLRDCAAYGQQVVFMPDGKVGICHGLWPDEENSSKKTYFDIDINYSGLLKEHPNWKEWGSRTPFNMPSCWNCAAISLCGGGCAKNSLIKQGTIWSIDKDICILMNEVIPWIIWTYYDQILEKI